MDNPAVAGQAYLADDYIKVIRWGRSEKGVDRADESETNLFLTQLIILLNIYLIIC